MNRLRSLLANKHTSGAAIVYAGSVAICQIASIWFPQYKAQIESTCGHIKEACFVWMGIAATDSGQLGQVKKDVQELKTGTNIFTKPQ